ncbi:hypothetical protein V6N13_043156 [Hibiscus sabdariffa]
MDKEEKPQTSPHVLIFPLPTQGNVNSMLKLAELLALAGLNLTFLNSDFIHEQLVTPMLFPDSSNMWDSNSGLYRMVSRTGIPEQVMLSWKSMELWNP